MKRDRTFPDAIAVAIAVTALVVLSLPAGTARAQQVEAPEHRPGDRHHHGHHEQAAHGYLGASVRPLNPDLRRHFGAPSESGVLVASVEEGSAAAASGLAVGDVIVALDGRPIGSVAALHRAVRSRSGERVELEIYRDGDAMRLVATLEARPSAHRDWDHGDWEEYWEEWGEGWAEWGEEWGEGWAEWGAEFGERWAEFGSEMAEQWSEHGAEWGEIGAEIGMRLAEAFAEMDWHEMDEALEESMRALEQIDWEEIGDEIDRALEEVEEVLDETLDDLEDEDRDKRSRRPA